VIAVWFVSAEIGIEFNPMSVLGPLWLVAVAISRIRLLRWPCPRCAKTYLGSFWVNEWADHCAYCKLEKWR
jgi:hypothetical protein